MANFNKCCCFSLQTGCVIVGWLGLTMSLMNGLSAVGRIHGDMMEGFNFGPSIRFPVYYTMVGVAIIGVVMNGMLIYGAYKKKHILLLPWLITTALQIISIICLSLAFTTMAFVSNTPQVNGLVFLAVCSLFIALEMYIWLCVLSFFKKLKREQMCSGTQADETGFINVPLEEEYSKPPPPYNSLQLPTV